MLNALRQVPLFSDTPDGQLQWIVEHGAEIELAVGEVLFQDGDPANYWYILLAGELRVTNKMAGHEVLLSTYQAGTFFGEVPILLDKPYFVSCHALSLSHLLQIDKDTFWHMITKCEAISKLVLQKMAERVQNFYSVSQQHEKLIALGTLAAGLAHELNNPAAAVSRNAKYLNEIFQGLPSLALQLNRQQMTPEQSSFLAQLQSQLMAHSTSTWLDPIAQSEQEDELTDWLSDHHVTDAWKIAPTLVGAGIGIECLEKIGEHIPAETLTHVLSWLADSVTGKGLLDEIQHCATRISELIQAIKDYSYMDQAPLQEVDVHAGIENTLTILSHKLKYGVTVTREYAEDLPRVNAYGSELNQVWTNLIDNAIDATNGKGQIWIRTSRDNEHVVVEIADNGSGIPPEILSRIFEPFFTTKGVGKGTGLGLDVSYRIIVKQHHGDIRVFSQPGDTHFQVWLPIDSAQTTANK